MIVKHIPARPAGRDATIERARHARNLIDYLRQPEKRGAEKDYQVAYMLSEKLGETMGERLFHIGARNFVSINIEGQRAEMIAVAQAASRSPNPIDHWLLSWREGELPTPEQVDATVSMFVKHLGVGNQPCIYACHGDTDNRHVHLALNRYDPLARRMIEINHGFTREAAHQAVALIVDRFGWEAEADARYLVTNGRLVMAADALARMEEGRKSISAKAASFENRTGYRSAQRIVLEDAVPRIKAAKSWRDLHASLAEIGISYDIVGTNGVVLTVGDERVKASGVDRAITRTKVEKQLGAFERRLATVQLALRDPEGDRLAQAFRADEYRAECERWQKYQQERGEYREAQSILDQHRNEQTLPSARNHDQRPKRPPPNLESWYYSRGEGIFAERWRHRLKVANLPEINGIAKKTDIDLAAPIDSYRGYPCSDGMRYALGPDDPTAFFDHGTKVTIVIQSDRAMLAALRLAILKFDGNISVQGDAAFRNRLFEIAQRNELGHTLTDPDLVERWRKMQPAVKDPTPAMPAMIYSFDEQAGESELAGSKEADRPIAINKNELGSSDTFAPADGSAFEKPWNTPDNTSHQNVSSNYTMAHEATGRSEIARHLAHLREGPVLAKAWLGAFEKLVSAGGLPERDDAGRWKIDTAGLSDIERRALSHSNHDAETQGRLAAIYLAQVGGEQDRTIATVIQERRWILPTVADNGYPVNAPVFRPVVSAGKEKAEKAAKRMPTSDRTLDTGSKGPKDHVLVIIENKGIER